MLVPDTKDHYCKRSTSKKHMQFHKRAGDWPAVPLRDNSNSQQPQLTRQRNCTHTLTLNLRLTREASISEAVPPVAITQWNLVSDINAWDFLPQSKDLFWNWKVKMKRWVWDQCMKLSASKQGAILPNCKCKHCVWDQCWTVSASKQGAVLKMKHSHWNAMSEINVWEFLPNTWCFFETGKINLNIVSAIDVWDLFASIQGTALNLKLHFPSTLKENI